ncbi:MAG: MerR family transcriptional regulator [Nitrospirota bacterium]
MNFFFTAQHIESIFGINRKVLFYWKKIGLITPSELTNGGHARYTFPDLVAIKAVKALRDAGISTNQIKKSILALKKEFPNAQNVLAEKSLYVIGKEIIVADSAIRFNPVSKQCTFINNNDMKAWVIDMTVKHFSLPIREEERKTGTG